MGDTGPGWEFPTGAFTPLQISVPGVRQGMFSSSSKSSPRASSISESSGTMPLRMKRRPADEDFSAG